MQPEETIIGGIIAAVLAAILGLAYGVSVLITELATPSEAPSLAGESHPVQIDHLKPDRRAPKPHNEGRRD